MNTDWGALQRAIEGNVVLPGSADYESVRKPVMARFERVRPTAVVRCATPADVAATPAVARGLGPADGDPADFGKRRARIGCRRLALNDSRLV